MTGSNISATTDSYALPKPKPHLSLAELAATVDNSFAFAATAGAVTSAQFDRLYEAYLGDPAVAAFLAMANPAAEAAMRRRFEEAMRRGLWQPRSNSAAMLGVAP